MIPLLLSFSLSLPLPLSSHPHAEEAFRILASTLEWYALAISMITGRKIEAKGESTNKKVTLSFTSGMEITFLLVLTSKST